MTMLVLVMLVLGHAVSRDRTVTASGEQEVDNSQWECIACTYKNHEDLFECEMCQIAKPN